MLIKSCSVNLSPASPEEVKLIETGAEEPKVIAESRIGNGGKKGEKRGERVGRGMEKRGGEK